MPLGCYKPMDIDGTIRFYGCAARQRGVQRLRREPEATIDVLDEIEVDEDASQGQAD